MTPFLESLYWWIDAARRIALKVDDTLNRLDNLYGEDDWP